MSKRKRLLPDINHVNPKERSAAERQAVNSVIQGSGAGRTSFWGTFLWEIYKILTNIGNIFFNFLNFLTFFYFLNFSGNFLNICFLDIIKAAMIKLHYEFFTQQLCVGSGLLLSIHDELLFEVNKEFSLNFLKIK